MSQVHINRRRAKETLKTLEPRVSFALYAGRTMMIHVPVMPRKLLRSASAMTVRHRRLQWRADD
jgi:hypothetical protein